jgi:hypothetical protein
VPKQDKVFFVNEHHRQTFIALLVHFGVGQDREYMAACYILAHPEIARKVNWSACEYPFEWLKWRGNKRVDLSTGFRLLVEMAANLYNSNNKFNLMDALHVWDDKCLRLFYQAVDIRLGKVAIDEAV